ncbi:MAG: hypothetical protein HY370_07860 [Proteobacteria bacterium]|nr:hypothetical protein [Pseudomonadota bacterium]
MEFLWKKRKDDQSYAGFVAAQAAPAAPEKKTHRAQSIPPPPADNKAAHEMTFLEILAAFYDVNADYFNNDWKSVLERFTLTPDATQWSQKNDSLPLIVQLMAGTQKTLTVTRDSVTVPNLSLDRDAEEAMKAAIEMAILARANPAMANGVELVGTDEEKAVLAAAAAVVGLQVKNPPHLDDGIKALAQKTASQLKASINASSSSKPALQPEASKEEQATDKTDHDEPFDSLDDEFKKRLVKYFNDQNVLGGMKPPEEEEIRKTWDDAPPEARRNFVERELPVREKAMKEEFEMRARTEKVEQEKRDELARALSMPRNVLTDPLPAAIVDILRQSDIETDLYQKIKTDILKEPEPEDRRKSRVSSASVKKLLDEKYKIPGDMREKTKTILAALEQEGIVRMSGSNRRVILVRPNGMLIPSQTDAAATASKGQPVTAQPA